MNHPALPGRHRVEFDLVTAGDRLLGSAPGALGDHLFALLPVARGVEYHPLAFADPLKGGLEAEQLERVDRLATAADQQAVVVFAFDCRGDRLVVFFDHHGSIEFQLVEHTLDHCLYTF